MDIANISMGLAQSNLLTDVSTAMLCRTLDMSQSMGDAVTKLIDSTSVGNVTSRSAMELSVNPNVGANIDISC